MRSVHDFSTQLSQYMKKLGGDTSLRDIYDSCKTAMERIWSAKMRSTVNMDEEVNTHSEKSRHMKQEGMKP